MINPIHTAEGKQFKKVFGKSVLDFWDPFTGFEIMKFDAWLKTPDNLSTKEFVETKFGAAATGIVSALINLNPACRG